MPASTLHRVLAALLLGAASAAHAGYHVTAFGDTPGFEQIMQRDYASAVALLETPHYRLDADGYARHANLCVGLLMSNDLDGAMENCQRALTAAPADLMSSVAPMFHRRYEVMTHLYSNRGVVRAVRGDLAGARADFQRALALDGDNANARRNLQYVSGAPLAQRAP